MFAMRETLNTLGAIAFTAAGFLACLSGPHNLASAATIDTDAREAILVDAATGAVLMEKDSETPMPPASMSKIMTAYTVFTAIREGRLSLDDELPVSEKAWRMGGSKMFVEVGTSITVEDLLKGVIIQSGNDACIVLAEGLAGTEDAFAQRMTELGREIGLENSTFANATGWPDPNQRMTASDLATLARRTIEDFPEFYHYYSEKSYTYHDIRQGNRNPLLYKNMGADGLKTGHTEEAGYGLTASAVQNDRRLVLVVNGLTSVKNRAAEAQKLIAWGFREFENYDLFKAGEIVDQGDVWLGEEAKVPLILEDDLLLTLPRKSRKSMKVKVVYESPIPAPIRDGQQVATLRVEAPDFDPVEVPLVAGGSVEKLGPFGRLVSSVEYFVFGSP